MRARLLGSGVLGSDDLAVAELVFHELANKVVVERLREVLRLVGVCDLDALVEIVRRDEVALGEGVKPRVLEMPDGSRLTDRSTDETDDAWFLAEDLRVPADLALRRGAFLRSDIGGKRELRDFAAHVPR